MFCYKITFTEDGKRNYVQNNYYVIKENAKDACEYAESTLKKNIEFKNLEIINCKLVGKAL